MEFLVTVSYATDFEIEVEAETKYEAKEMAKDEALDLLRNHSACTDGFIIESIEKVEPDE